MYFTFKRTGYVPTLCIGAFCDENLVGFVLNGFRNWNSKATIYDLGTGVIREYIKQGFENIVEQYEIILKL
ncbi:hypothetical protein [Clostridium oceanicum]|uniref:Uncharacterized protein n=1 Tax=Clostridium oceanicum TaxID=1543 RepID=A0ABN1JK13_9CLOT